MSDESLREDLMATRERVGRLEREVEDLRFWCGNLAKKISDLEFAGRESPSEGDPK